ncbi:hypothetical protein GGQ84_000500 [Desulfitispora alkaliphila]|uniref:hypothetical protein n=1 Tax=Desulfitispora alkaliphila TaxID=622674 RepID=UPI003D252971
MQLTEEQQKIVISKINQIMKSNKKCLICMEEKWTVSDKIYEIGQFGLTGQTNRQMVPVITLTCNSCGNTILLNAMTLGFKFNKTENKET